nr:leucine-rich repeat domain-containing protein [Streptomyces sp. SID12501]
MVNAGRFEEAGRITCYLWIRRSVPVKPSLQRSHTQSLPPSMVDLRELRHLDLRENALTELPERLVGLPRLRQFDVRSNRLTRLPDWVVEMTALEKLDVRWNACEPSPSLLTELERRGCVVLL